MKGISSQRYMEHADQLGVEQMLRERTPFAALTMPAAMTSHFMMPPAGLTRANSFQL